MKRRTFIAGLGSAAAWPVVARAQQGDRVRRIGVLMPGDENDPVYKRRVAAFTQTLASLGWSDGRNVRMELRWHGDDTNRIRTLAQELVGLQPDIIPDRLCERGRPRRQRHRPAARPPEWEHHRLRPLRGRAGRQVAWVALRDRARPKAPHLLFCPQSRRRPGRSRSC